MPRNSVPRNSLTPRARLVAAQLLTFDTEGTLVACNKKNEGTIRWKGWLGKSYTAWFATNNAELKRDMDGVYEKRTSAVHVPQYVFRSGLTHTFVNYKLIPLNEVPAATVGQVAAKGVGAAPVATFNGVLLVLEMVSLNDILVQTLSRHMDRKLVAATGAGAGSDKQLRGHSLKLSLAMFSLRGGNLEVQAGGGRTPEAFSALNEAVGAVASVVQKEGGMLVQLSAGTTLLAAFGYTEEAAAAAGGGARKSHVGGDDDDAAARAHAAAACGCALKVAERVDRLNKKQKGGAASAALELAAGVHTDVVGLGTVGFEKLLTLAVLGDGAARAAAVHAAAAREKVGVVCSAATLALLPPAGEKGALAHKELPPAEPIAGADESVAVYELVREAAK